MKKCLFIVVACAFGMACNEPTNQNASEHVDEARHELITDSSPVFVTQEEANDMIQGYLSAIDYPANDTSLRSLLYNADSLRSYLTDTSIHQLKLMFAENASSDNHSAVSPACFGEGLTIIMAGVDANGNYRLYKGGAALNHGVPCPKNCMVSGTAAANTIVLQ